MTKKVKQSNVLPDSDSSLNHGISSRHARNIYNKAFSSVKASHDFYCSMVLECAKLGLLKISDKQKRSYKGSTYSNSSGMSNFLLTNHSATSGKPMAFVTCNDHHAPLNEVADSSRKLQQREFELRLANQYVKKIYGRELRTYMLTITVPNCSKGKLKETNTKLMTDVSAFLTALKNAQNRNGSFNMGTVFYGAMTGFEVTVNSESLDAQASNNLFHPHAHSLLLTADDDIDVDVVEHQLFEYWKSKNKGLDLSEDAFELKPTYTEKSKVEGKSAVMATLQGGIEATKYITKPDAWARLEKQQSDKTKSDSYTYEVFAELYKASSGVRANRTMGLMLKSAHFAKLMKTISNSIDFTSKDDSAMTPDIVTHLSQVGYNRKSKRLYSRHERKLNYMEILYFNRDILKGLFTNLDISDFDADVWINRWPDTEKGRKISAEIAKKFNDATYDLRGWLEVAKTLNFKRSMNDVFKKLRSDISLLEHRISVLENNIANNVDNHELFQDYRQIQIYEHKKLDLMKLIKVLKWASTYKERDLNTGQVTRTTPVNYDGIILDAQSFNIPELDVRNVDEVKLFGRKFNGRVLGHLVKCARNGFDLPQMPSNVNVSQQVAIYRKMMILSGIVSETAYRSGIRTARKSDAQLSRLVDMVGFSESPSFTDDFSFDDFKAKFSDVISEVHMSDNQAKMWSVAMYNYLGIINADNLDVASISNIPAPVIYFGLDLNETDFFNMLMGRAQSYKPIRSQYISAIA